MSQWQRPTRLRQRGQPPDVRQLHSPPESSSPQVAGGLRERRNHYDRASRKSFSHPPTPIYLSCSISNKITRVINYRIPPGVACHPRGMGVRHGGTELSIYLVSSKPRSHPRSGFQRTISRRRSLAMRATPTISSQFLSILMVLLLCRQGIALPYLEPTPKRRKELSTYHTLQLDAREPWIDLQLDWR